MIRMDVKGKFPNGLAPLMDANDEGPTALANAIGTSAQNVSRWKKESRKIPHEKAKRIAAHYGVTVAEVMFPEADGIPEPILRAFRQLDYELNGTEKRIVLDALDLIRLARSRQSSDSQDSESLPVGQYALRR